MPVNKVFPKAFQCYKPYTEKVYGSVCMTQEKKILLVRGRKSMKWSFPKGHKESGESYQGCAERETLEETGISLRDIEPVAYHRLSVGGYYFYEMEEKNTYIQDTDEVVEACWMPISELQNFDCNVDVNAFLSKIRREMNSFRSYH